MRHPIRYRLEWLALICLRLVARALPSRLSRTAGAIVGRCVQLLWRRRRLIAEDNLRHAFPEWAQDRVQTVTASVFRHFGRTTFEILRIGQSTGRELLSLVDSDSAPQFEKLSSGGKGAILISAHFGNWELLAGWIRATGYPLDVVVKPMRNPLADEFYNARRRDLDVGIIHTQVATRGIIGALRQNRLVAILADQYAGEEGVQVEFFGRKVSTPRGPAVLALKFGCPIQTGVMIRLPNGRFKVEIDPPINYEPTGREEEDVIAITQAFTANLENHIRRMPDQWLWTHRRWRD